MRTPPLIVTLEADPASQARFEAARARWFPAERNHVPAHVTLLHQMPGVDEPDALLRLARAAARGPVPFRVAGVASLGRGAAYRLDLPGGGTLRDAVAPERIAQDRGPFRPHVTVQNKVDADTAAATVEALRAGFAPWDGHVAALRLWRYLGGPWEAAGRVAIAAPAPPTP